MTARPKGKASVRYPSEHVRHYPLDLPSGLPFACYEHRRLSTRDILVHRILSKLLFPPTCELAQALDQPRQTSPHESEPVRPRYHSFGPVKPHDPALARDIEVLRKTLTCSLPSERIDAVGFPLWSRFGFAGPPVPDDFLSTLSIHDEVLDLLRIYFLETDDAATRLWLRTFKLPHRASLETLRPQAGKQDSRTLALQNRRGRYEHHAKGQYKRWYPEDQAHLKTVRTQLQDVGAGLPRLYEGGVFLPRLQQPMLETKALRLQYMGRLAMTREVPLDYSTFLGRRFQFPSPEPRHVPLRCLHVPSYHHQMLPRDCRDPPAVAFFAARTGRGLDRDGIWSTHPPHEGERGRTRQRARRQRSTSEPPPGLFMMARLSAASSGFAAQVIIAPKMSLVTMQRRLRSRSLSRTRIAEMFNWDAVTSRESTEPPPSRRGAKKPKMTLSMLDFLLEDFESKLRVLSRRFKERLRHIWATFDLGDWDGQAKWRHCWTLMLDDGDISLFFLVDMHFDVMRRFVDDMDQDDDDDAAANDDGTESSTQKLVPRVPCENCKATWHEARHCPRPCGYCGAANPSSSLGGTGTVRYLPAAGHSGNPHMAPQCPVAPQNRCKCVPFPQYHVAAKCTVPCARDCGNAVSPGHFKHKSAMTCQSRCCMCGMRGHSGTKCKLKRCRCGGSHLGQDCRFHPECRVPGCDRFLCGVHCQECGQGRAAREEGVAFVDQKCPACGEEGAGDRTKRRRNRPRHRRGGPKPEREERPWYAPLEPRTRPIVLSKSGKRANARYHKDGSAFMQNH